MAWERVMANRGAGGIDGESIATFGEQLGERLDRLHEALRTDRYTPRPVRRVHIPKAGKPGEHRTLGIPTIYDRVCQQALLNQLEPIFEPVFDEANFSYRRGRSLKDALRKVWKEFDDAHDLLQLFAELAPPFYDKAWGGRMIPPESTRPTRLLF